MDDALRERNFNRRGAKRGVDSKPKLGADEQIFTRIRDPNEQRECEARIAEVVEAESRLSNGLGASKS